MKKNEEGSIVLIVVGIILALVIAIGAFLFVDYSNTKNEGIAAVEEYMVLLKEGNSDELKETVLFAYGVSEDSTDPKEQEILAQSGVQTAYVSRAINDDEPTIKNESFGTDESGNKQVTIEYEIEINEEKAYYTVSATEVDGEWVINRINLDASEL